MDSANLPTCLEEFVQLTLLYSGNTNALPRLIRDIYPSTTTTELLAWIRNNRDWLNIKLREGYNDYYWFDVQGYTVALLPGQAYDCGLEDLISDENG